MINLTKEEALQILKALSQVEGVLIHLDVSETVFDVLEISSTLIFQKLLEA